MLKPTPLSKAKPSPSIGRLFFAHQVSIFAEVYGFLLT